MAEGKEYSYITGRVESFVAVDYVLFAFTLLVSAGIGVFYAIKDRNVKTTKSYLLAGGNMSVWPAALSLVASFMSAITLLGTPAEIYNFDTMFMDMTLAYIVSMFLAAYVYIPILYRLHITSVYEVSIYFRLWSFFLVFYLFSLLSVLRCQLFIFFKVLFTKLNWLNDYRKIMLRHYFDWREPTSKKISMWNFIFFTRARTTLPAVVGKYTTQLRGKAIAIHWTKLKKMILKWEDHVASVV